MLLQLVMWSFSKKMSLGLSGVGSWNACLFGIVTECALVDNMLDKNAMKYDIGACLGDRKPSDSFCHTWKNGVLDPCTCEEVKRGVCVNFAAQVLISLFLAESFISHAWLIEKTHVFNAWIFTYSVPCSETAS